MIWIPLNEDSMREKNKLKTVEQLPEAFTTEEEAGEFWDTHSTMDYMEYLRPIDDAIDLQHRVFDLEIEEDTQLHRSG